jgi:hypothetical protein
MEATVVKLTAFEHVDIVDAIATIVVILGTVASVIVVVAGSAAVAATRARTQKVGNDVRRAEGRSVHRDVAAIDHASLRRIDRRTEERRRRAGVIGEITMRHETTIAELAILIARTARRNRVLDACTGERRVARSLGTGQNVRVVGQHARLRVTEIGAHRRALTRAAAAVRDHRVHALAARHIARVKRTRIVVRAILSHTHRIDRRGRRCRRRRRHCGHGLRRRRRC